MSDKTETAKSQHSREAGVAEALDLEKLMDVIKSVPTPTFAQRGGGILPIDPQGAAETARLRADAAELREQLDTLRLQFKSLTGLVDRLATAVDTLASLMVSKDENIPLGERLKAYVEAYNNVNTQRPWDPSQDGDDVGQRPGDAGYP